MNDSKKSVKNPASGISIAGLTLGICSVVLFIVPVLHFLLAVLGTVFSSIAISRKEKFGGIGLGLSIGSYFLVLIYFIIMIMLASAELNYTGVL